MHPLRTLSVGILLLASMTGQTMAQELECNLSITEAAQASECNSYWDFVLNWNCVVQYLQHLTENREPSVFNTEESIRGFLEDTCDLS